MNRLNPNLGKPKSPPPSKDQSDKKTSLELGEKDTKVDPIPLGEVLMRECDIPLEERLIALLKAAGVNLNII